MIVTYRLRLKDKHAAELNRQARAVNYVWNYCNETQVKAVQSRRPWLNWRDLERLTCGSSKMLRLHSATVKRICNQHYLSRRQKQRPWLRFRGRRSLGWVPFGPQQVAFDGIKFTMLGRAYAAMRARDGITPGWVRSGSFNRDTKGRWYINIPVEVQENVGTDASPVGVDIGLSRLAALSNGKTIETPSFYRKSEGALAQVQRAKKPKRVSAIHTKIRNRRRDFLHKETTKITKEFGLIVVGDVSSSALSQTWLAKSVHDAGWSDFKRMLSYKSIRNGGRMLEVSEKFTSQTCSECGERHPSWPQGIAGLSNRMWQCGCGAVHDRDVNAARNILAIGLDSLGGGAACERSSQYRDRAS